MKVDQLFAFFTVPGTAVLLSIVILLLAVLIVLAFSSLRAYIHAQRENAKDSTLSGLVQSVHENHVTSQALLANLAPETSVAKMHHEIQEALPNAQAKLDKLSKVVLGQNEALNKVSKVVLDRNDALDALRSNLESLRTSINIVAGLLPDVQEALVRSSQLHGHINDIGDLIESRHNQIVALNRSWLETPYPTQIALCEQHRHEISERVLKGLGIQFDGRLQVQLLCDRHGGDCIPADDAYTIESARWGVTREAAEFYLKTGILLLNIKFGRHAAEATGVLMNQYFGSITDLYQQVVSPEASEVIRDLVPEVLIHKLVAIFKHPDQTSKLQADAVGELGNELARNPIRILDGGGSLHLRLGALIELQDGRRIHEKPPFGGLSRALVQTAKESKYEWLCEHHRHELQVRTVSPSV